MGLVQGVSYNLKGLRLGLKTPRLLMLGLVRVALTLVLTGIAVFLAAAYYQDMLGLIWAKPASVWVVWLWHAASWLLMLLLIGASAILAYLASQVLFSVVIMDQMSRITEKLVSGHVHAPVPMSVPARFFHLVRQEIPRAVVPVLSTLVLVVLGWTTPLGPVITLALSAVAGAFLAWDSTDLTPARRMEPFRGRFRFLQRAWAFHLGFGLLFLVPVANILFLAFSPVGATMYFIETQDGPPGGNRLAGAQKWTSSEPNA
jgi:CysZ protein